MPRLMKYSKYKNIAKNFENVPDPYLVAIEYGGISYILDAYFPTRDKATHALQLTAVLLLLYSSCCSSLSACSHFKILC